MRPRSAPNISRSRLPAIGPWRAFVRYRAAREAQGASRSAFGLLHVRPREFPQLALRASKQTDSLSSRFGLPRHGGGNQTSLTSAPSNAAREPEARKRRGGGQDADRPEMTQRLSRAPLHDQPAAHGAQAAGDVLHRCVGRHEATTPLTGRLVDRFGGLSVFRGIVPLSATMMLILTHLPAIGIAGAAPAAALLMASNSGRMVTAMSLITASIEPRRRGSFMSVNSSVQHVASGLGTMLAGLIVEGGAGEPLRHFGTVGSLAAVATIASLWVAARIRPVA